MTTDASTPLRSCRTRLAQLHGRGASAATVAHAIESLASSLAEQAVLWLSASANGHDVTRAGPRTPLAGAQTQGQLLSDRLVAASC